MKSFRAKDGSGEPSAPGRNGERNFKNEPRSNETHASTTDPEARLYRKDVGRESRLCFMGHALMENRHGPVVDAAAQVDCKSRGRIAARRGEDAPRGRKNKSRWSDKTRKVDYQADGPTDGGFFSSLLERAGPAVRQAAW